jgi:thiol-disulfide isomerase/thioredoxin
VNRNLAWLFVLAGLLGLSGGWVFNRMLMTEAAVIEPVYAATPDDLLGRQRPAFRLGSIDGRWVSATDFDGKVWLLNFWATWCEPCRAEMPMLDALQRELASDGFRVVGIALDDVQQARDFVAELGLTYTALVGLADVMETGRLYGNSAGLLPYSVLVDREGAVRWTRLGELSREQVLEQVQPLL